MAGHARFKGRCPVLMGSLHSWQLWWGAAHRLGEVNTFLAPSGMRIVPWNKQMWPRTAHFYPQFKNRGSSSCLNKEIQVAKPLQQVGWKIILCPLLHTVQQWWNFIHTTSGLFLKIRLPFIRTLNVNSTVGFFIATRHRKLILRRFSFCSHGE